MTQHDGILEDQSGASFLTDINNFAAAVLSNSKGNSRPSTPYAGQQWTDDNTPSASVWSWYHWTGSADIKIGELNTSTNNFMPFMNGTALSTVLGAYAPLNNAALTGNPTAPTQSPGDNSTKIATTAYVDNASNPVASQAEMEAAASTSKAVTPGRAQYHPGMAKAWVVYNGLTNSILASHNVSSVTDNGSGDFTINFTTPFSSADYAMSGTTTWPTATSYVVQFDNSHAPTASACRINVSNAGDGNKYDTSRVTAIFYGDQ